MEAIEHLTKELEILHRLLTTPERVLQELNVQITLGEALIAVKGYAASEVEHVYVRAQELCQQVGEASQIWDALGGLWNFYLVRETCRWLMRWRSSTSASPNALQSLLAALDVP